MPDVSGMAGGAVKRFCAAVPAFRCGGNLRDSIAGLAGRIRDQSGGKGKVQMVTAGAIAPAINGKYHISRYGETNHVAPSPVADTMPIEPPGPVANVSNGHLRLPMDSIIPSPDYQGRQIYEKSRSTITQLLAIRNGRPLSPVVVRPVEDGRYMIVIGQRHWQLAKLAGMIEIDAAILNNLSDRHAAELRLSESYHDGNLPCMALGAAFLDHRKRFGTSQQELARKTGITPGTIHHYESLVRHLAPDLGLKVDSGLLTFKEARSLADIQGHERQRELAEPFLSGKLSSVYVEKVINYAKHKPQVPVDDVLRDVLAGTRAAIKVKKPTPEAPRAGVDIAKLESAVLDVAGTIDAVQLQQVPEYRRLKLISSLRILKAKTLIALEFLNSDLQTRPLRAVV